MLACTQVLTLGLKSCPSAFSRNTSLSSGLLRTWSLPSPVPQAGSFCSSSRCSL